MADITFANPPAAGTTVASNVMDCLADRNTAAVSLTEIDGRLDYTNLKSGVLIQPYHVRDRSLAFGEASGCKANNDMNTKMFSDVTASYLPLRGASKTFYVQGSSLVIVSFQIIAHWRSGDQGEFCRFRLYYDDSLVQDYFRAMPPVSSKIQRWLMRCWNGAYTVQSESRGWHSASIRMYTNGDSLVRIRNASMKVLQFRL